MKLLHVIYDDKFPPQLEPFLGKLPDVENRWVVHTSFPGQPLKYVGGMNLHRIADDEYLASADVDADLLWCDCLVVHFLTTAAAKVVARAPPHVVVVWSGWGADYYGLFGSTAVPLLGDQTRALVDRLSSRSATRRAVRALKRQMRAGLEKFLPFRLERSADRRLLFSILPRIDLFSAPTAEDFPLVKQYLGPSFRADYVQLRYGAVGQHNLPSNLDPPCGSDILLGNSAFPTNNHLEAFDILSRQDLRGRRIIVPLSYGWSLYRDAIISRGTEIFGKQFIPVVDFLPLPEYRRLLAECSVAIMNHCRQQAGGNIGIMIDLGARVFMNKDNSFYKHFTDRGAYLHTLNSLEIDPDLLHRPLSLNQREKNRAMIMAEWGEEALSDMTRLFVMRLQTEMIKKSSSRNIPSKLKK